MMQTLMKCVDLVFRSGRIMDTDILVAFILLNGELSGNAFKSQHLSLLPVHFSAHTSMH